VTKYTQNFIYYDEIYFQPHPLQAWNQFRIS